MREDGRENPEIRPINIIRGFTKYAEGSVLIEMGETKIICTASVEERVPYFKKDTGEGWITAEYSMLPRSTQTRNRRDISSLRISGRSQEIQRLIGRALRSVVDLKGLGERTIIIDCDVIQADGGTRVASIIGGFVSLVEACGYLIKNDIITKMPIKDFIAAISVGIFGEEVIADLCYREDSNAQVDMNVVMSGGGKIIEIQATGEQAPFSNAQFSEMLSLAETNIDKIIKLQREILGSLGEKIGKME